MKPEAIFGPVGVLAVWTGVVLFLTGFTRLRAVRRGRVRGGAFRLGESKDVPDDVAVVNRNLMNLLEMPVLFYVACLSIYVTRHVTSGVLRLAWIYVGLRLLHSLIHLTRNVVVYRLLVFAVSNVVLLAIWIGFIRRVL